MMTMYCYEKPDTYLFDSVSYFDALFDMYSLDDPYVSYLTTKVDKTPQIMDKVFKSPVLGIIPPQMLSGGVKSLLCIYIMTDKYITYDSSMFGDNCIDYLCELSFKRDFGLYMSHPMRFVTAGKDDDNQRYVKVCAQTEDGRPLHTCNDLWGYYYECTAY